jgi:hypothetical protein
MGIEFDRVLDDFTGPFEKVRGFEAPPKRLLDVRTTGGYYITRNENDAFTAVNRALAAGIQVSALRESVRAGNSEFAKGTFFIPASAEASALLARAVSDKGIQVTGGSAPAEAVLAPVRPTRIALYDVYGGSIESGWTRFLLERFEFPFTLVFPPDINAGRLAGNFDLLILPNDAAIGRTARNRGERAPSAEMLERIPAEYRNRVGTASVQTTLPRIREFLESGGNVIAMGNASALGLQLGLPVTDALADSAGRLLPSSKFYVPASVLRISVDTTDAIALGMSSQADVFYDNNPTFTLKPEAGAAGIKRVGWFDSATPLRSGWAWGQSALAGTAQIVSARIGKGHLFLFGPDIQFRHQSQGTFKLLFNGIYLLPND